MSRSRTKRSLLAILLAATGGLPALGSSSPAEVEECIGCYGIASPAAYDHGSQTNALLTAFAHVNDGNCMLVPAPDLGFECLPVPCTAFVRVDWVNVYGSLTFRMTEPQGNVWTETIESKGEPGYRVVPNQPVHCGDLWDFELDGPGLSVQVTADCTECVGF